MALTVAVIGGGPVGLVASIQLSLRGIDHVMFERHPSTSIHPKAMGLNHRTTEILRQIGVWEEVQRKRAPPENVSRTAWYTSLGPTGRTINTRDGWGGGAFREEYEEASHVPYVKIPQMRLEPILKRRAIELNPNGIYYHHEVMGVDEKNGAVTLEVLQRETSKTQIFEASYAIIADGGRSLTNSLGIEWEGEQNIVDMVGAHVRAPISLHHPDLGVFLSWFVNPELGGSMLSGYLYHLGPWPRDPKTEEWNFACARLPDDPERFDESSLLKRLHETLKIPGLTVELLSLSHWYVNACTAERYRNSDKGRIFLVGDAAHKVPPFGALGLNTGIQDVNNLVWKLGLAVKFEALDKYNALLNTYEEERLPIAQRVAKDSLTNMRGHIDIMDRALGISVAQTAEDNLKAAERFFDLKDLEEGAKKREAVEIASRKMDIEFHAIGQEDGWFYPMPDDLDEGRPHIEKTHGGQMLENGEFDTLNYHPSTIPGHHVPHLWLERDGERKSTRDLLQLDRFLLLASSADLWLKFQGDLVHVEIIGKSTNAGWRDVDRRWDALRGIGPLGALLIRPDGIIAWRTNSATPDILGRMPHLLMRILKIQGQG